MLPIPAPIIGSTSASVFHHRKLFIPLIYLAATATICYLFLFAFIVSNQTFSKGENFLIGFKKRDIQNGIRENQSVVNSSGERKDQKELLQLQLALSSTTSTEKQQVEAHPQKFERKKLVSLRKRRDNQKKNGTRRSNPTKVWSGHQDLDHHHHPHENSILDRLGHDEGGKLSNRVYTFPWFRDEQCKTFTVQFATKDSFKPR